MLQFSDLKTQLLKYIPYVHVDLISKAYYLAEKAHTGQLRHSGEPYITHPLAVAEILAQLRMDPQTICAALLHDVLEDTPITKDKLEIEFGTKISELVDGVSKLTCIESNSREIRQADSFRKMMLAMSADIRVILIKLADRLHNLRTLAVMPKEKRHRIAKETLEIYAPLANRLGMNAFRVEFEDLSFAALYPKKYQTLISKLKKTKASREHFLDQIIQTLQQAFSVQAHFSAQMFGRERHLYGLFFKLQKKDLSLSQILDVHVLRVILDSKETCYQALGLIHSLYKPNYHRFKDYIAVPKSNGYQALHTTVFGPSGIPIELQICTADMDKIGEYGIAAHWLYGQDSVLASSESLGDDSEKRARAWLSAILEIQQKTPSSIEFLEHLKLDLHTEEVYVFTPNGDIFGLPRGATCIDFAYAIHTTVGNRCVSAKIDRRLVPLSTILTSGQVVEIISSEAAHPSPAWLSFAATGKARSSIRHWLKNQKNVESQQLGKRLLERAFLAQGMHLVQFSAEQIQLIVSQFGLSTIQELYQKIGLGQLQAPLVAYQWLMGLGDTPDPIDKTSHLPLAIEGTEGLAIEYATCCYPIPGDRIVGVLLEGQGLAIHRAECAVTGPEAQSQQTVFVRWSEQVKGDFATELSIDVLNQRGVLALLAGIFSGFDANIENVRVDERDYYHNSIYFIIHVRDRRHLSQIIRKIREVNVVTRVKRCLITKVI